MEVAPRVTLPKEAWELKNLHQPISESSFTARGRKYIIFRYGTKEKLTLQQTIEIAERMGHQMLTLEEARAIRDNGDSDLAFMNTLKPNEWSYVRNPESEKWSRAAYLCRGRNGLLYVGDYYDRPDDAASVVILKEND